MAEPAPKGQVKISNEVLARMVGFAAMECYGVVGMANPSPAAAVAQLLGRGKLAKGVIIDSSEGWVAVDLYVVIEYGTNLAEVSRNLQNKVRYELESRAQVEVRDIAIHVERVKVRKRA